MAKKIFLLEGKEGVTRGIGSPAHTRKVASFYKAAMAHPEFKAANYAAVGKVVDGLLYKKGKKWFWNTKGVSSLTSTQLTAYIKKLKVTKK